MLFKEKQFTVKMGTVREMHTSSRKNSLLLPSVLQKAEQKHVFHNSGIPCFFLKEKKKKNTKQEPIKLGAGYLKY